jgi:hypothetical protein
MVRGWKGDWELSKEAGKISFFRNAFIMHSSSTKCGVLFQILF